MKSLVIAEKPSVGRDIARVLHCSKNIPGALEGDKYIVTWALGHLVTLADPEEYDKKYSKWDMETLPMMPEKMQLVVIRQTAKQYGLVKKQLFRKDVNQIIIATDAGREGELVARWILEKSECKKPIKRLWISSVTDKAIREGFANLRDGRAYNNLYHAAKARAEADWLVGINATRAMTDGGTPRERDPQFCTEGILWHAAFVRRRAFHLERCKKLRLLHISETENG